MKHLSLKVARKHRKPLFEWNMNEQVKVTVINISCRDGTWPDMWEIEKTRLFSREIFLSFARITDNWSANKWRKQDLTSWKPNTNCATTDSFNNKPFVLFFWLFFAKVSFVLWNPYPLPFCIQIEFSLYKYVFFFCFVKNTCRPDRHDTLLVSRTQLGQLTSSSDKISLNRGPKIKTGK